MYLSTSQLSALWVGWSSPLFWIGCKPILGVNFQRKPKPPGELPLTPAVARGCSPIYVKTWTFSVFSPLRLVELRGGGPDHRHAPARSTYGLKSHTWSNRNESHNLPLSTNQIAEKWKMERFDWSRAWLNRNECSNFKLIRLEQRPDQEVIWA